MYKKCFLSSLLLPAMFAALQASAQTADSTAHDGELAPCQREAQEAVNAIAKINKLQLSNDLVIDVVTSSGTVTEWKTVNNQFQLTTNTGRAEHGCYVSNLIYNPEP